jgi:hypothetical protein
VASFPNSKVHRSSRRKLGKNQHVQVPAAVITPTVATTVITLTFSLPMVISGTLPVTSNTGTFVSQAVVSSTVVTQTWSVSQASAEVAMAANPPTARTNQGGGVAAFAITF